MAIPELSYDLVSWVASFVGLLFDLVFLGIYLNSFAV
jgi:hypothetical protein